MIFPVRSIRFKLFATLFVGMLALSGLAGAGVYLYVALQLRAEFDETLLLRARALGALVDYMPNGTVDMDFSVEAMPEFAAARQDQYFEVWMKDGTVLERAPSLGTRDLRALPEPPATAEFQDLMLFNGSPGRAVVIRVLPHQDLEEDPIAGGNKLAGTTPSAAVPRAAGAGVGTEAVRTGVTLYGPVPTKRPQDPIQLVLVRDRGNLDQTLMNLMTALVLAGLVMSLGVPVLVLVAVQRGLRPLDRVARHAANLDEGHLDSRFPAADLPLELQPICDRLNHLLERLDQAFDRERRFTGNAAHELRTPIAELRSLAEVALQYPPEAAANRAFYQDVAAIAKGMERIVTVLLQLARNESAPIPVAGVPCDLAQLAQTVWTPLKPVLAARQLKLNWTAAGSAPVVADADVLQAILHNLFRNAVEHATAGSTIAGGISGDAGGWTVILENATVELSEADVAHFGEPFWRHESARSPGEHAGLGLTLVGAFARALGIRVTFERLNSTRLRTTLVVPPAAAASAGRVATAGAAGRDVPLQ